MRVQGALSEGRPGGGAPREEDLLAGAPLEGEVLAARTGQLDVMLEYLWQVPLVADFS